MLFPIIRACLGYFRNINHSYTGCLVLHNGTLSAVLKETLGSKPASVVILTFCMRACMFAFREASSVAVEFQICLNLQSYVRHLTLAVVRQRAIHLQLYFRQVTDAPEYSYMENTLSCDETHGTVPLPRPISPSPSCSHSLLPCLISLPQHFPPLLPGTFSFFFVYWTPLKNSGTVSILGQGQRNCLKRHLRPETQDNTCA